MRMTRRNATRYAASAALVCASALLLAAAAPPPKQGSGAAPTNPPAATPPTRAADTATAGVDATLPADYIDLIAQLPKPDQRGSATWFGLTLDAKGLVADKDSTDATVPQLTKTLIEFQPVIEKAMALAARPGMIPKNAGDDPKATAEQIKRSGEAVNAMRSTARLLSSDACRLFVAGKSEESAKRFAACLGVARQLANGSEYFGLHAAAIVTNQGDLLATMHKGISGRKLTDGMKSAIREAFERLDPNLPFGCPMPASRATRIKLDVSSMKTLLAP